MIEFKLVEIMIAPDVHELKGFLDVLEIPAACSRAKHFYLHQKRGEYHCGSANTFETVKRILKNKLKPIGLICYKHVSIGAGARIDWSKSFLSEGFGVTGYQASADGLSADLSADEAYRKGVHAALAKTFTPDESTSPEFPDVYSMSREERLAHEEELFRKGRDAALRAAFGLK